MPKIITPDNFDHWLELRSEDISSTDSAALFGISPYNTEFQLYHEKRDYINDGTIHRLEDTERMYVGRNIEDTIAAMASERFGFRARRLKTYMRHDSVDRMGSSFDYEIVSHERGPGLLEIKNVDSLIYRREWEEDEAPPHIECQVQHQMEVANKDWCVIVALVGGNQLVKIERDRDREVGQALCTRIEDFWAGMSLDVEPIPNYKRDASFIIDLYGRADGEKMDISEDNSIKGLVWSYRELRQRCNDLEVATKAIKAEVFHRVGGAAGLFTDGGMTVNLTRTKNTPPTTITEDMVGTEIGGRQGYRQFRVSKKGN